MTQTPEALGIIAGKGVYPRLFAEAARAEGVGRLVAVAFRGETERVIEQVCDEVRWLNVGQLERMLDAFRDFEVANAVMVGQITPSNIFRVRVDARMRALLARLPVRNAQTIFGAVGEELRQAGVELLPAYQFMESAMPAPGLLTQRPPSDREQRDIELGFEVARVTSGIDIGQTVVIKDGVILAVEAFEGTDKAILRAGSLGGPGAVVVKMAKPGHDMRFDIPVVGLQTLKSLKKGKAAALAVEAGRTILLERERIVAEADRLGLTVVAIDNGGPDGVSKA